MKRNKSLEANLQAAKTAVNEMTRHWRAWKHARDERAKTEAIAAYAAAFTSCKVYIENYLKQAHPNEAKLPKELAHHIQKIVNEMDAIEKMDEKKLGQALQDIGLIIQKAA